MDRINKLRIYGGRNVVGVQMGFHGRGIFPGFGIKQFLFDIGAVGCCQCVFEGGIGAIEAGKGIFTYLAVFVFHQRNKTAVGDFNLSAAAVVDGRKAQIRIVEHIKNRLRTIAHIAA